jgi:sugar (pentulose or hexulose) kinase
MKRTRIVAIFDIGKTNKKLFLFDEGYKIILEESVQFEETTDEDGYSCEDIIALTKWVKDSLTKLTTLKDYKIVAINFSAYGASFVHVDDKGNPAAPLYNYLKPYPEELKQKFYDKYGGEILFSLTTASPVLGSLNSGLQLYRLKNERPGIFAKVKYSLHLPQYLSSIITGKNYSDITSIGCHTGLWNFQKNNYHDWVSREAIIEKLAQIISSGAVVPVTISGSNYAVGVGLHDSSAALIPYLNFQYPFMLISTGTWCISLNPFNHAPLTREELDQDCLCYMSYQGKPVKASRLFAGRDHEKQLKRIADYFNKDATHYNRMQFNPEIIAHLKTKDDADEKDRDIKISLKHSVFALRDLADFASDEEAYYQLITDLVNQQLASSQLVLDGTDAKRIFVDGGFSKNDIYMNLLASVFPEMEVFAASMAQSTAMGVALSIHSSWNKRPVPNDIIELKYYSIH